MEVPGKTPRRSRGASRLSPGALAGAWAPCGSASPLGHPDVMSGGSARAGAGLRWAGEVRDAPNSHWRGWGKVGRMAREFSVQGCGWSAGHSPDEEQGRCSRLRRGLNSPAASQLCLKEAADLQMFSCCKGSHRSHLGTERPMAICSLLPTPRQTACTASFLNAHPTLPWTLFYYSRNELLLVAKLKYKFLKKKEKE